MAPGKKRGRNSSVAAAAASAQQWNVGDLVLAKVKGFPAWPAQVSKPEAFGQIYNPTRVFVVFFGTKQIRFCHHSEISKFTEEAKALLVQKTHSKCTPADLRLAVDEILQVAEQKVNSNGDVANGKTKVGLNEMIEDSSKNRNSEDVASGNEEYETDQLLDSFDSKQPMASVKTLKGPGNGVASEIDDFDMGWGSPISSGESGDGISGDETGSKGIVIVEKVQTNFASHEEMDPFDSFEFFNEDDGSMPSCASNMETGKTEKPSKCDKGVGVWSKQGSRTPTKSRKPAASFTPAVPANVCRKKRKQITTVKTSMPQAFSKEVSPRGDLEVSPITHDPDSNLPIVKRARARAKEKVVETHEEKTAVLASPTSVELVKSDEKAADIKPLSLPPKAEKYRIRSSLADNEAALPPSKRLHRALEAMTACVAEAAKEKSAEATMAEERSRQFEEESVKQIDEKQDFALQDKDVDPITMNLQVRQTSCLNTELADGIQDFLKITELAAHELKGDELLHGGTSCEDGSAPRKDEEVLHDIKTAEGDACFESALENAKDAPEVTSATQISEDVQHTAESSQDGVTATLQNDQEEVIMKVEHAFESEEALIENVVSKIEAEAEGNLEMRTQEAIEVLGVNSVVNVEEATKVELMSAHVEETVEDMEENRLSPVSMDMSEDTLSDLTPTKVVELQSTAERPEDCKDEHQAALLDVNADSVKPDAMQEVLMGVQSDTADLRYSPVSPAVQQAVSNSMEAVQRHSPKAHVQSLKVSSIAEETSKDFLTVIMETEIERHLHQANDVSTESHNLTHSPSSPTTKFASMVVKTAEATISEVCPSVINNNTATNKETSSMVSPTRVNYTAETVGVTTNLKPSPAAVNDNSPKIEETSGLKVSPTAVNNNPTTVDVTSATKVYSPHHLQHKGEAKSKSQKIVKRHSPHTSRECQSQHSADSENEPTPTKSRSELAISTKPTSTVSRFDGEVNNIRKAYEAAKELKQKMASDTSASRMLVEFSAELNHANEAFNEPNPALIREANHINDPGQASLSAEAQAARDIFEGLLHVLSRTKDSIGRATRQAIDCAKLDLSEQVIDLIARKLEVEQSYPRRIDLFFLVDSITQTSHTLRGTPAGIYRSIVQNALPRLLSSAAPPGSFARENRRQCLKVFKQWSERNIFPPSVIRHFMEEIELHNCDRVVMNMSRRPARNERPVDDPIREMEGMQVDEYGSNVSFPLRGITVPREEEEANDCGKAAVDTSQTVTNKGTQAPTVERHPCILEDVDGELEMEDASPQNDTWQNQRQQYVSPSSTLCGPPLPMSTPPPLPSSPPPDVPLPPPPGPSQGLSPSYHHVQNSSMQPPFNNYEQYNPGMYGSEDGYGYSSYEYGAHPAYGHSYQDGQAYHPDGHSYNPEGQAYPQDGQRYSQNGQPYYPDGQPYHRDGQPYHPDGQPYPQDGQPYQQDGYRDGHLYQDGQSYYPESHNYQENHHPDGHTYPADYQGEYGYGGSYEVGQWSEGSPRGRYLSHNPPADDPYLNPQQEYHDRHGPSQEYHQNGPPPPPYHYEERASGRYVSSGGYPSPEREEKYHHYGRRKRHHNDGGGYSKFSW